FPRNAVGNAEQMRKLVDRGRERAPQAEVELRRRGGRIAIAVERPYSDAFRGQRLPEDEVPVVGRVEVLRRKAEHGYCVGGAARSEQVEQIGRPQLLDSPGGMAPVRMRRDGGERERLARPDRQPEEALDVIGGQRDHASLAVREIADWLQVDRAASGRRDERRRSFKLCKGLTALAVLREPVA